MTEPENMCSRGRQLTLIFVASVRSGYKYLYSRDCAQLALE
jgi:hypothetical protein